MAAAVSLLPYLLLFLASYSAAAAAADAGNEAEALMLFKSSLTNASALSSWSESNGSPCSGGSTWSNVVCDGGAVAGLRLGGLQLSGRIDVEALSRLPSLRSISLNSNSFSGAIPPFSRLQALKSLYLSGNSFSGRIPGDFFAKANHLKKLWLSGNAFEGPIPLSLCEAVSLKELHLERNRFSGAIPAGLPTRALVSLDVSMNRLSGPIPPGLRRFGAAAFAGNAGLCGPPLENCGSLRLFRWDILAMMIVVIGAVFAVPVIDTVLTGRKKMMRWSPTLGLERGAADIGDGERNGKGERNAELVIVNGAVGAFGMLDLMKAVAEVMGGNGGMGSAFKAVMAGSVVVGVKRVRVMNRVGKEAFDTEMRQLGRINHRNILPPLAYHFRKDEKLIVSEYIPKGSLLYILHGDRGQDHEALNWATRLKIIRGIAAGMSHLHSELSCIEIPHGNLKSSNVLLGPDLDPLLVDYGFLPLVNSSHASHVMFAFKSPEILLGRNLSPKADVFCLGILILELLSGKFPSLYLNNSKGGTDLVRWADSSLADNRPGNMIDPSIARAAKPEQTAEMERMVLVGADLAHSDPDRRPDMREAARRIEEAAQAKKREGLHESLVREGKPSAGDAAGSRRTASLTERSRSIGDHASFAIS